MARPKLSDKRAKLLSELEQIIGGNCYNDNIQNWGAGGTYYGEGRHFRYPITLIEESGEKKKCKGSALNQVSNEALTTGFYAFGANRLHIIKALDEAVSHLEDKYSLKL